MSAEPPFLVDGARVVRHAVIDPRAAARPHASVVAEGITIDLAIVTRLVIAEEMVEGGAFLLHCNDDWETVAAGQYGCIADAQAAADAAYAEVAPRWQDYRTLTDQEKREVEVTREFLRELARDFPSG